MKNAIVAQSGGPTAVINASLAGVVSANKELKYYNKIYGGVNGIEGILQHKIIDLNQFTEADLKLIKYTPSAFLGSCRYKIKDFQEQEQEYKQIFALLDKLAIQTVFYIGGNDSMDTVNKLSDYARWKGLDCQMIGIPKTIDNDLAYTDHTPGFGSAAKYIATTILETYLDASVYPNNGIFLLETMGRDTGWLAASAALARLAGESVVDFIYLPEIAFCAEGFLKDVVARFEQKNKVYIVVAEGLKDASGNYLFEMNSTPCHDGFAHFQLGGVSNYLKKLILENTKIKRIKNFELGVAQRSSMHCISGTDLQEAYQVGEDAVKYSTQGHTGFMVGIKRIRNNPYTIETFRVEAAKVASKIKHFPPEWINQQKNNVTEYALDYITPLLSGTLDLALENGLPKYFYRKRGYNYYRSL